MFYSYTDEEVEALQNAVVKLHSENPQAIIDNFPFILKNVNLPTFTREMKDDIIQNKPYYFDTISSAFITAHDVKKYVCSILSKHDNLTYKLTYAGSLVEEKMDLNTAKILLRSGYICDKFLNDKKYFKAFLHLNRKKYIGSDLRRAEGWQSFIEKVVNYYVENPHKINVKVALNMYKFLDRHTKGNDYSFPEKTAEFFVIAYPIMKVKYYYELSRLCSHEDDRFTPTKMALYKAYGFSYIEDLLYGGSSYASISLSQFSKFIDEVNKPGTNLFEYNRTLHRDIFNLLLDNEYKLVYVKDGITHEVIKDMRTPKQKAMASILALIKRFFKIKG